MIEASELPYLTVLVTVTEFVRVTVEALPATVTVTALGVPGVYWPLYGGEEYSPD